MSLIIPAWLLWGLGGLGLVIVGVIVGVVLMNIAICMGIGRGLGW
jgi:hypothetical protein